MTINYLFFSIMNSNNFASKSKWRDANSFLPLSYRVGVIGRPPEADAPARRLSLLKNYIIDHKSKEKRATHLPTFLVVDV